jgi:2-oxoglutarate ferredoxin oxidoreductase subunit gamma
VTMLKSHGTEMRGGYVRSQVVLSKDLIDSPMCESPGLLCRFVQRRVQALQGHGA